MTVIARPRRLPILDRLPPFVQSLAGYLLPTTVEEQVQSMVHPMGLGSVIAGRAAKPLGKAVGKVVARARPGAHRAMDNAGDLFRRLTSGMANPELSHWARTGSYPSQPGAATFGEAAENLRRAVAEGIRRTTGQRRTPAFKRKVGR